jgi:hypothetical protein
MGHRDAVRFGAQAASAVLVLDGTARVSQLAVLQAIYGTCGVHKPDRACRRRRFGLLGP